MSSRKVVKWSDVAYAARIALAESVDEEWKAYEWIWQAWEILIQSGLTKYSTKIELYEVVVRFFALVCFYIEFCNDSPWEEWVGVEGYLEWAGAILIDDFNPQELSIYAEFFIPLHNKYSNIKGHDNEKIIFLINKAFKEVIAALREEFGQDSILFDSLLQSTKPEIGNDNRRWLYKHQQSEIDEYEKDYAEYSFFQAEVETMNEAKLLEEIEHWVESHEDEEEDEFYETEAEMKSHAMLAGKLNTDFEKATGNINQFFEGEVISLEGFSNIPQNYVKTNVRFKPKYSLSRCVNKTGFEEVEIKRWMKAINRKKQAILYGSPGTGKTYIADKLAKYLIGSMDDFRDGFLELVQFHPAYAYEDFIQGIRPQARPDGRLDYQIVPGRFLEFCHKAESREGLCVLIIDEINRANLAQVFGELMYLLEYRDKKIRLAGSSELFAIPENVRIIGTMNTADRSIALVDHALRRRFAFIELCPNYDVLRRYHEKKETGFQVDGLIETLKRLNHAIANKHYEIGISFFLRENLTEELEDIWQMEIEPYLEEYFYDQLDKVDEFRWDKIKRQVCP
jgi:5-methylcytosine-specific restriction protein B